MLPLKYVKSVLPASQCSVAVVPSAMMPGGVSERKHSLNPGSSHSLGVSCGLEGHDACTIERPCAESSAKRTSEDTNAPSDCIVPSRSTSTAMPNKIFPRAESRAVFIDMFILPHLLLKRPGACAYSSISNPAEQ